MENKMGSPILTPPGRDLKGPMRMYMEENGMLPIKHFPDCPTPEVNECPTCVSVNALHTRVAGLIFHRPVELVTEEERTAAKCVYFGAFIPAAAPAWCALASIANEEPQRLANISVVAERIRALLSRHPEN